jgi:hypothetical protein
MYCDGPLYPIFGTVTFSTFVAIANETDSTKITAQKRWAPRIDR